MTFHLLDIWNGFQSLPVTTKLNTAAAINCGSFNDALLIKGELNNPILLIRSEQRTRPRAPIKLKNIQINFDVFYEVLDSDKGISNGFFTRFSCTSISPLLQKCFIEILVATYSGISENIGESQTDTYINAILELFRRFSAPPKTTVVGLWGELLLILASRKFEILIDAWHDDPFEKFDFSLKNNRFEVKTSEQSTRIHNFTLQQLLDSRDGDFVVSILVKRSPSGMTVFELLSEISKKISIEHYEKLLHLVLETLGEDAEIAESHRFDHVGALASLSYLPMHLVPKPTVALEYIDLVSNVRFTANITKATQEFGLKNILLCVKNF